MAETILNIDDDEAGRYAVNRILRRQGFRIIEAADGNAGYHLAVTEQPDLILLDVNLPDTSGFDLCRQLKHEPRTASIPVLILSASFVANQDQVRGLEGGADGYLTEPLEPEVLIAHARALLRVRRAERQAERDRAEAEAANRAKDHFLAVLSHELRTPLNPVLASVEMLTEMDLADDVQRLIDVIRRNVLLEVRLIDDLLDLTRIARGKLEMKRADIDLHALILDVSSMCQTDVLGKGLILVLDLSASQHIVHADAARIQQVIWNLVKNAVKFTPRGGRIEVSTTNPEPGILRVVVSDTGIGIEEHLLAQIFDAFNQGAESTNRQYGGMGLGLAISRNIIAAHYGELTVASDGKGTGATFTIEMATTQSPVSAG